MTIPVWILLGFASWTLLVLALTVGVHRWSQILGGRGEIADYAHYKIEGADWYERSLRAHANCVENLPVYGALVVVLIAAGLDAPVFDILAVIFFGDRILHTLTHVTFEQTNFVAGFRSGFFNIQRFCMVGIDLAIVLQTGTKKVRRSALVHCSSRGQLWQSVSAK